ncbi:MAG: DUF4118 domain-containing protein [Microbacteriaceae bacterium]|nr:DUF4118 domain-containing protein [Burkholderiaceae bacterium]
MTPTLRSYWPAAAIWLAAGALLAVLDGRVDLANLAMLLVLASVLASLWLPMGVAAGASLAAVLAFNWALVPPRRSFAIANLEHHAPLLLTLLALSWISAGLMARLRSQADAAERHAAVADQLRAFGETLRDAGEPAGQAEALRTALQQLVPGAPVHMLLLNDQLPPTDDPAAALLLGTPDADQHTGLWQSLRRSIAFGPGTQRHEGLPAWYLPLRGRHASWGAALIELGPRAVSEATLRIQAQSLCDQMGVALERNAAGRVAQRAVEAADAQGVRNTLLAAIAHDYRTPLATILSAASALQQQDDKLSPAQRTQLAATIEGETRALSRMTDNTLQIARLAVSDTVPGVVLRTDWESAEEIVGAALRRARSRDPDAKLKARVETGLPLLRCDAVLMAQLLDNLIDNALKYAGEEAVEIRVRREGEGKSERLNLAVRDRGPGVTPAWRERIFDVFQRGVDAGTQPRADLATTLPRGLGIGLAACRAIAQAHGGTMRLRARSHGGASFECLLPLTKVPE